MKAFDDIYKLYSEVVKTKNKDTFHKPGQVREKYTEIITAMGIDCRMLKITIEKGDDVVTKLKSVSNVTAYIFPDDSVEFVVELLKKHTSSDFKKIRKGDFSQASAEELQWLIEGITKLLKGLGYPSYIVMQQKLIMEKHCNLKIHLAIDDIEEACEQIIEQANKYTELDFSLNNADQTCFLSFMASSIKGLSNYLATVYTTFSDIRSEEIYKLALKECKTLSREDIIRDLKKSEMISQDEELSKWFEQRNRIIGEHNFVKNKLKAYNIVNERINQRLEQIHIKVYGTPDVEESVMILKHPSRILLEAVMYAENLEDNYDSLLLARTKEQADFDAREASEFLAEFDAEYSKKIKERNINKEK